MDEFKVHRLNDQGLKKAEALADTFARCLAEIETLVPAGRERALVVTKMQEACFFAKRGIALDVANQSVPCQRCQECGYLTSLPFTHKVSDPCLDGGAHKFKEFPNGETEADRAHAEELIKRPRTA